MVSVAIMCRWRDRYVVQQYNLFSLSPPLCTIVHVYPPSPPCLAPPPPPATQSEGVR